MKDLDEIYMGFLPVKYYINRFLIFYVDFFKIE